MDTSRFTKSPAVGPRVLAKNAWHCDPSVELNTKVTAVLL